MENIFKLKQTERNKFCSYIIESSTPNGDFYFLVILSALVVALGIMANNIILIMGGMLITPILSPIMGIALGIIIKEASVILRSAKIFLIAFGLALAITFLAGLFSSTDLSKINIISIMEPSVFNFFIALVAGLAASYTWAKPNLSDTLPGIAITVTLIPPLAAIGLALSHQEWLIFSNSLKTFLLNTLGIIVSSLIIFSLMEFYKSKRKLVEEIKEEEKELKQAKRENGKKKKNK